jgi:hypothetical protein
MGDRTRDMVEGENLSAEQLEDREIEKMDQEYARWEARLQAFRAVNYPFITYLRYAPQRMADAYKHHATLVESQRTTQSETVTTSIYETRRQRMRRMRLERRKRLSKRVHDRSNKSKGRHVRGARIN